MTWPPAHPEPGLTNVTASSDLGPGSWGGNPPHLTTLSSVDTVRITPPAEPSQEETVHSGPPLHSGSGRFVALTLAPIGFVCVVLAALIVPPSLNSTPEELWWRDPHQQLRHAANELSLSPAVHYTGTVTPETDEVDSAQVTLDLEVTYEGSALGTAVLDGIEMEVLVLQGRIMIQAPGEYWETELENPESVSIYAATWVRVAPEVLGIDIRRSLAPPSLAAWLLGSQSVIDDGEITVNGGPARRLLTSRGEVAINEENRVLSIDVQTTDPQARSQFTLQELTAEDATDLYRRLTHEAETLEGHLDRVMNISMSFVPQDSQCFVDDCRYVITITNSVESTSPYVEPDEYVYLVAHVEFRIAGEIVAGCDEVWRMEANTTATMWCSVQLPPDASGWVDIGARISFGGFTQPQVEDLLGQLYRSESDNPGSCAQEVRVACAALTRFYASIDPAERIYLSEGDAGPDPTVRNPASPNEPHRSCPDSSALSYYYGQLIDETFAGVHARLCDPLPTGSPAAPDLAPPGYADAGDAIQRCHLIPEELGGSGAVVENLVACHRQVAESVLPEYQRRVQQAVADGQIVDYTMIAIYGNGTDTVPTAFVIRAVGDQGLDIHVFIENNEDGQAVEFPAR